MKDRVKPAGASNPPTQGNTPKYSKTSPRRPAKPKKKYIKTSPRRPAKPKKKLRRAYPDADNPNARPVRRSVDRDNPGPRPVNNGNGRSGGSKKRRPTRITNSPFRKKRRG